MDQEIDNNNKKNIVDKKKQNRLLIIAKYQWVEYFTIASAAYFYFIAFNIGYPPESRADFILFAGFTVMPPIIICRTIYFIFSKSEIPNKRKNNRTK